jgi:hypothetical protein
MSIQSRKLLTDWLVVLTVLFVAELVMVFLIVAT